MWTIASKFTFFTGSLIRPKIVRSVHYCPATKKTIERRYADMTSLDAHPTSGVYPTKVSLVTSVTTIVISVSCNSN